MKYFINAAKVFFPLFLCLLTFSGETARAADEEWKSLKKNDITFEYTNPDKEEIKTIAGYVEEGNKTIRIFFGNQIPQKFVVKVFPDRKSLTAFWRQDWKMPELETQCWMVASGTAKTLTMLSPRVWKTEACEHNPDNTENTQFVVTHELVHVFHGQTNPKPGFEGMDDVGWFVEGLAVYASGQLEGARLARPREAVERGKAPTDLKNVWSGKYRYGVAGSIVKFIDVKYGRQTLLKMLKGTTEKELLEFLNTTESELLEQWKAFVLAGR